MLVQIVGALRKDDLERLGMVLKSQLAKATLKIKVTTPGT